jgi:hypothetical protein
MDKAGAIRIGCSGWNYRHWREAFYPKGVPVKRWFEHYAATFSTVELNTSFYRLPTPETFEKWRDQAPPGFTYAVKAPRFITHMKKLKECDEPVEEFLGRARKLGPTIGPILYQLPPRWAFNRERLEAFLALLPRDLVHVFEFRETSWLTEDVLALLADAAINGGAGRASRSKVTNVTRSSLRKTNVSPSATGGLTKGFDVSKKRSGRFGRYDRVHAVGQQKHEPSAPSQEKRGLLSSSMVWKAPTAAAGPPGCDQTDAQTARKSAPASTRTGAFSGVIPPIATQGSSKSVVHQPRIDGSGLWNTSLVLVGKKAPNAT